MSISDNQSDVTRYGELSSCSVGSHPAWGCFYSDDSKPGPQGRREAEWQQLAGGQKGLGVLELKQEQIELFSSAQSQHTIYKLADALNSRNKVSKAWRLRSLTPHHCLVLSVSA